MQTPAEYKFAPLISDHDPSFEGFYRIYLESIPLREQKPRSLICAMANREDYIINLLKRNTRTLGFSILFKPIQEAFCLLEYMAVDILYRNSGLGSRLFRECSQTARSDQGESLPLVLEVDSDREPSPDQELRRRRQHLYQRLGCTRINQLSYILPLPGEGPPPKMDLMIHLPGGIRIIQKSELERWLKVIYQRVYFCPADDPRIAQMLEPVTDPVELT
jgi:N-acetylglutamate synthase-like GNAT family acetyltransferase